MKRYWWLLAFAVAMAYVEAAVVVYLRGIYYPQGFDFPLVVIPTSHALIELGREAATVLMLIAVGRLGAQTFWQKFSGFMFLFGVWDIFYYLWLKVFLDWPASPFTWDVLFLIPVVWAGPVLAPVIISLSLIGAALTLEYVESRGWVLKPRAWEWGTAVGAGLIVMLSFTIDWLAVVKGALPTRFRWWLFFTGEGVGFLVFLRGLARARPRRPR